jgi:hypothetical protein
VSKERLVFLFTNFAVANLNPSFSSALTEPETLKEDILKVKVETLFPFKVIELA